MSGLTFWAVNTIQNARLNDTRFGSDLGLLLASNVAPLIAENNLTEVAQFSQRFYSQVCGICYADERGKIFSNSFFGNRKSKTPTIERRIHLPEDYAAHSELPMVRQHLCQTGSYSVLFSKSQRQISNYSH